MYCVHLKYKGNLCSRVAPSKLLFIYTHGRETFFGSVGPRYRETLKDFAALLIFPDAITLISLFLLQRRFCLKRGQSATQDLEKLSSGLRSSIKSAYRKQIWDDLFPSNGSLVSLRSPQRGLRETQYPEWVKKFSQNPVSRKLPPNWAKQNLICLKTEKYKTR